VQPGVTPSDDGSPGESGQMTFLGHLEELRARLIRCVIAVIVAAVVCYAFSAPMLRFFLAPIREALGPDDDSVVRQLAEPFLIYMKVALLGAFFVASPYVFYEVWRFVSPGLKPAERRWAVPFVLGGTTLFLLGGWFGYSVLLPMTAKFLLQIGGDFRAQLDLRSAFSFEAWILLGLGAVFQIPVVIGLLARAGLVTARWLLKMFRYAIVLIVAVAAIITPTPDIITCCVFAAPMIGLYLIGILVAAVIGKRRE
jgi:sec-independent protein translocase protein TatC